MRVVSQDYNGAEKLLSPRNVIAILSHSAVNYSHVCGNADVNKPMLPVIQKYSDAIMYSA